MFAYSSVCATTIDMLNSSPLSCETRDVKRIVCWDMLRIHSRSTESANFRVY